MIQITDININQAEKILLDDGQSFDEQRRNFIKCIDKSLHLKACPGSGKTTALIAKLFILSEKMPFENNKGICVLTHTNVAINIIKKKLDDKADKLLNYPNFFGTIQSFVDKYLAIPAYIKCFGYRPSFIDTELFERRLVKYAKKIEHNNWLKNNKGQYETVLEFLTSETTLYNFKQGDFEIKINNLSNSNKTYKFIKSIFFEFVSKGYIRFEDAYSLAKDYLYKLPELNKIFSERFKYAFIDEAQDTSSIQREIIEKCFNENVIIQWIGDINQGIMNDNFAEPIWEPLNNDRYIKMEITNSHRISQPIADIVKHVSVNKYVTLNGNQDINIKPKLIVFDENSVNKVLDKFIELVTTLKCRFKNEEKIIYEISQLTGNPIKAIGWVGKERSNGLSIKSYFPNFDKKLTNIQRQYFPNLYTMCMLSKDTTPKEFKERTISCISESLYISNINSPKGKIFSKTDFLNFIKEQYPDLYYKLMEFISKYFVKNDFDELSKGLIKILQELSLNLNQNAINFLSKADLKDVQQNQIISELNIFQKKIENKDIKIYIDTVHGAKGETHTATLYLETKYHSNSIHYYINSFQAISTNSNANNKRMNKALKIAHVAFSRPTHLLCIAIHKDDFENNKEVFNALEQNGICEICNLEEKNK